MWKRIPLLQKKLSASYSRSARDEISLSSVNKFYLVEKLILTISKNFSVLISKIISPNCVLLRKIFVNVTNPLVICYTRIKKEHLSYKKIHIVKSMLFRNSNLLLYLSDPSSISIKFVHHLSLLLFSKSSNYKL